MMVTVNPGPWTVTGEEPLVACCHQSIARVYGYASLLTAADRNHADAVVQDVYLGLVRSARDDDVREVAVGELLAAVRRCFVDAADIAGRRNQAHRSPAAVIDEIRVDEPELATVPDRERAALVFRYVDGLPLIEVAELTDLSMHATEALLARARRRVRLHDLDDAHGAIAAMAGDGLAPTTEFETRLCRRMVGEWNGEVVAEAPEPGPPWRTRGGRWLATATVVVLVMAGVAWAGARNEPPARGVSPDSTTVPLSASTLPASAVGHVWVVTSVGGVPWANPSMASFAFGSAGLLSAPGFGGPSVAGPYTFTSEFEVHTDGITAERFDRADVDAPDPARTYRFGTAGSFTLGGDGTMSVDGGGCGLAVAGTYELVADRLQFDLAVPDCAVPDVAYRTWLQAMVATGARIAFHGGPAGGLWTELDGVVTRLAFGRPAQVVHSLGDDASPNADGLRVAEWTGADLIAKGVVLDELHVGVRVDGALVSVAADGRHVLVIDDDGRLADIAAVDAAVSRLAVRPGDVAALVDDTGTEVRLSVRESTLGAPRPPAEPVVVVGPLPDCTYDVELGDHRWSVPQRDCATALVDPVALSNGSVIALTQDVIANDGVTAIDDVIELAAIRLNRDGSQQRAVLGRHAVDGAEGWIVVQPTETGGLVVFHYPDDQVVLYRYLFS